MSWILINIIYMPESPEKQTALLTSIAVYVVVIVFGVIGFWLGVKSDKLSVLNHIFAVFGIILNSVSLLGALAAIGYIVYYFGKMLVLF